MDAADLVAEINKEVRGCPLPSLIYAIKRSARIFCQETWLVRRTNSYNVTPNQQTVQLLANDTLEEVIAVRHAHILNPANNSKIPLRFLYPEYINPNASPGQPTGASFVPYTALMFDRPPDVNYVLYAELVMQPSSDGEYIPDELGVKYRHAIGYGALEYVKMQRGNDWYDPQGSQYYRALFNGEIARGRGEAQTYSQPGQWRWVRNPFAMGGGLRGWGT
ncbi:MAG: hypothetical protein IRZ03_13670 [Acidobacterium ailaaui]|nr:hypothetical protein [Pseudacidobacterium ailaaui]